MQNRLDIMDIYVGNLPYKTTDDELQSVFAEYGEVARAKVISDRETGRSRGFGFVTMADAEGAKAAIEGLNETDFQGRTLRVREAEDRRPQRSGPR